MLPPLLDKRGGFAREKSYRALRKPTPLQKIRLSSDGANATTPVLQVALSIGPNNTVRLRFAPQQETSAPVTLSALVANRSHQPAYHSVLHIGLDADLGVPVPVGFDRASPPIEHANDQKIWFIKRFTSAPEQPIFREGTPSPVHVNFSVATKFANSSYFDITTIVQTPGFASNRTTDRLPNDQGPLDLQPLPVAC
jgi:hypothetical protein